MGILLTKIAKLEYIQPKEIFPLSIQGINIILPSKHNNCYE